MKEVFNIFYIGNHEESIHALTKTESISVFAEGNTLKEKYHLRSGKIINGIIAGSSVSGNDGFNTHDQVKNSTIYNSIPFLFTIQKFRSEEMKRIFLNIADDLIIARVRKIFRNISIDELPQLLNSRKSDMSIAGIRPLAVYESEMLTVDSIFQKDTV